MNRFWQIVPCVVLLCAVSANVLAADGNPVRIGILTTKQNAWGDNVADGARLAAHLAVEDWGGKVAGRPIKLVEGDHQNRPKVGASIVRHWLQHSKIDVVLDVPNGGVARAVQPVLKELNGLAIISGSGFEPPRACQNNIVVWTYDLAAMSHFALSAFKEDGTEKAYLLNLETRKNNGSQAFQEIGKTVGFSQFETVSLVVPSGKHNVAGAKPLLDADMPLVKDDTALVTLGAGPTALQQLAPRLADDLQGKKLSQLFCQACAAMLTNPSVGALAQHIYFVTPYEATGGPLLAFMARFAAQNNGVKPTPSQVGIYTALHAYLHAVETLGRAQPAPDIAQQLKAMKIKDDIMGSSTVTAAGIRRGSYYLYAYDPETKDLERIAQQDLSANAGQEGCVADAGPTGKPAAKAARD